MQELSSRSLLVEMSKNSKWKTAEIDTKKKRHVGITQGTKKSGVGWGLGEKERGTRPWLVWS